jgi:hypothetical protein
MAAPRKVPAEFLIPMDHLAAKPDDQEERPGGRVSEGVIFELKAVGGYVRHFGISSLFAGVCSKGIPRFAGEKDISIWRGRCRGDS